MGEEARKFNMVEISIKVFADVGVFIAKVQICPLGGARALESAKLLVAEI